MRVSKNKKNNSALGPSVKLVSPNRGLISKRKIGVDKIPVKKTKLGRLQLITIYLIVANFIEYLMTTIQQIIDVSFTR